MPLDEATRRLVFLLQRDMRRLLEKERARGDRGEEVRYDSVSRMATWETRRGDVIGRWYGEVIANYVLKDRILRWAWAGRGSLTSATHAELIFREGQTRAVPQLSMSVIGDLDEDDAGALARLGVIVSRGEGIELQRSDTEIAFIGLFDSPRPREGEAQDPSRYSVPPPAVTASVAPPAPAAPTAAAARESAPPASNRPTATGTKKAAARQSSPPPNAAPYRSLPPIRETYGPRTQKGAPRSTTPPPAPATPTTPAPEKKPAPANAPTEPPPPPPVAAIAKVREPARGIFFPVASAVLAGLTKAVPKFQQALFVLTISTEMSGTVEKRRLLVMLVAVDSSGVLRQVDPSHDLVEMAARMVEADRVDGNGPWRKLSARITPKADGGATLNVDVL